MSDHEVPITGPLCQLIAGFRHELERLGYRRRPAEAHVALLADLSQWLERQGVRAAELTTERVGEFLDDRRRRDHARLVTEKGAGPLLGYLRREGVIPGPSRPRPRSPMDRLVDRYHHYLLSQRGLAPAVVSSYEASTRLFLTAVGAESCDLATLSAADVSSYVVTEAS